MVMADYRQALTKERCPELQSMESMAQGTRVLGSKRNVLAVLLVAVVFLLVVAVGLLGTNTFDINRLSNERRQSIMETTKQHSSGAQLAFSPDEELEHGDYEAGARVDDGSDICDENLMMQFFPDMDYAMLGYNLLKGYPLADGHDPGFTLPIFQANYSMKKHTADCRYMVPQGLVVIPDISCVTSFSSKTVKTKKSLSESLSASAKVEGSYKGFSFSASTEYKKTSEEISTGNSVYIISQADCNYYFSKLSEQTPPPFDQDFLQWVYKLNYVDEDDQNTIFEFLDTYGTHFFLDVTFGAKYIYEHKMESSTYESMIQTGVDVEASANYAGEFSLGGEVDEKRRTDATNFLENVQTNTITVGAAPPYDGDTQTWASMVHNNPVPVTYTLSSIENIFTENYMGSLKINLEAIFSKLNASKIKYCQHLQDIGLIDSCQESTDNIFFYMTNIITKASSAAVVGNRRECIKICSQVNDFNCNVALWAPNAATPTQPQNCYLYKNTQYTIGKGDEIDVIIVRSNIHKEIPLVFNQTTLTGISTTFTGIESSGYCGMACVPESGCVAYTYCDCSHLGICRLFTYDGIQGWKSDAGSITTFVNSNRTNTKSFRTFNRGASVTTD